MSKRNKTSVFSTARAMGRNIGKVVMASSEKGKVLAKKGSKGLKSTAEAVGAASKKAGKKAKATAQETIPQLVKEFRRGLKEGMKKRK